MDGQVRPWFAGRVGDRIRDHGEAGMDLIQLTRDVGVLPRALSFERIDTRRLCWLLRYVGRSLNERVA
jgi:hypothetical protein